MPASLFKMKSGGSSAMLPPPTGCERREVRRWLVVVVGHLELAVQARSRLRSSCEAITKGLNGTATAQPASTAIAAATTANFNVFQLADASGRDLIASPLFWFCPAVWLGAT